MTDAVTHNLPPAAGYPEYDSAPRTQETLATELAKLVRKSHMCRVDTAMCVWEMVLTLDHQGFSTEPGKSFTKSVDDFRSEHGVATLRNIIATSVAPWIDSVWLMADDDLRDRVGAFDWGFVPHMLVHCVRFGPQGVIFLPWEG